MAAFTSFNDRLPDPTFGIGTAGQTDNTGQYGPGFASVTVTSNRPVQSSRTISGRGVQSTVESQYWEIAINYNPMKRDDFDVVSSFLDARNGKLNPFYVVLPQYSKPKDALFATFVTNNTIRAQGAHSAGSPYLLIDAAVAMSGAPSFGDFFTISDPTDAAHLKVYKVVRVESNTSYRTDLGQPTTFQYRVWTLPPLVRTVSDNSVINWINPKFRVIQKSDTLEYALDTNNTYQFQLQLEEIQV